MAPGLSLPAHLFGDQILLRRRLRVQKCPGHRRPPRSHYCSDRRGTENNGRDRPAPRRAHWLRRTAPGNSALLLTHIATEGGRLCRRHCGRCSPPRPPVLRAWERSLWLIPWAVPEDQSQKIRGLPVRTPVLAIVVTWSMSCHFFKASLCLSVKSGSWMDGREGPFQL